jgi:hypothetical protein
MASLLALVCLVAVAQCTTAPVLAWTSSSKFVTVLLRECGFIARGLFVPFVLFFPTEQRTLTAACVLRGLVQPAGQVVPVENMADAFQAVLSAPGPVIVISTGVRTA